MRNHWCRLWLTLILFVAAAGPAAAARHALLVGIDDYTGARPAGGGGARRFTNLAGAVRDARDLREMLVTSFDFPPERIRLLVDREATRAAILAGLEELAAAGPGDEVLFYFAGHGSQVENSLSDEPDRRDETLVPADAAGGARDLRDKELGRLFLRILGRGARLTVILDACHSGSAGRGLPARGRKRALLPDRRDVAVWDPPQPAPEERGALVLSAAQDFASAWEVTDGEGRDHGAFSFALLRALGTGGADEPAERLFLRLQALLQATPTAQDPVLAGSPERLREPLFTAGATRSDGPAMAVRRVAADGTVVLQAGWAHGLRPGSELVYRVEGETARLRVSSVDGPASATARRVGEVRSRTPEQERAPSLPALAAGDLIEPATWITSDEPSLAVWIPRTGKHWKAVQRFARRLAAEAPADGVGWCEDPVRQSPTHVLTWEDGGWWLTGRDRSSVPLGSAPDPVAVLRRIAADGPASGAESGASLFVHLPVPKEVADGLRLGAGSRHDAVAVLPAPSGADYQLVGRLAGEAVELAWIRPEAAEGDAQRLPPRTDWHPLPEGREDASAAVREVTVRDLEDAVLRLAKIRAWLTLEPPAKVAPFPWELVLRDEHGRIAAGELPAKTSWGLALRARPGPAWTAPPRYVYVWALDSYGNTTLLFPPLVRGSVENCFPLASWGLAVPAEIPLGPPASFEIAPPFGRDTFFLLATEEPLVNPWVLEVPGVRRSGPRGRSPLDELLSQRGAARRGDPIATPVTWSLERQTFTTVGPTSPAAGGAGQ
jgi:hypothetical protein